MKEFEKFSDIEIIHKILSGETRLFEIIIRRCNPYLHKTGRAYGFNHDETQDLMQETFINVYENLSKFENRSSFKTWIVRIMLNNCFHTLQKYKKQYVTDNINENSIPMHSNIKSTDTISVVLNQELNHIIENSLCKLPREYRMVFSLREILGLNVLETASAMNISEANVKVRLNRAKKMLKQQIEKIYDPQDIFDFNLVYCDAMVDRVFKRINELV